MAEVFVSEINSFSEGDRRVICHDGIEIGIFRWRNGFYAYRNKCRHQGGPACEGLIIPRVEDVFSEDKAWIGQRFSESQTSFICPWHGYEYDITTGECVADSKVKLRSYQTVERDGGVYVIIE